MAGFVVNILTDPKTLAVFFGVLVLAWIFYPRKKYKYPPGPTGWPIVGSTFALLNSKKHGHRQYMTLFDWAKEFGSVMRVKSAKGDMVVISEIKEAMEALVTKSYETAGRMSIYSFEFITDGGKDIAMQDFSETVRYQRRIAGAGLRNLFSGGRLQTMTHASLEKGIRVLEDRARNKVTFDPRQLLTLLVFNVISAMCFNVNFELDDEEFQVRYNAYKYVSETFAEGLLVDFFPPARLLPPVGRFKEFVKNTDVSRDYIRKQIVQHKATYDRENLQDFIDHMLKVEEEAKEEEHSGKKVLLDDEHYLNTITDIFTAGVDTTSQTLLFIIRLLAEYPDVQRKVQEEIDKVIGRSRFPCLADKPNMPYCEAVMYECMRFGPIVPVGVPHKAMCDLTIGGYDVPKDTIIMINHYALHRDPKEWKHPDGFDPSHFLADNGELLPKPRSFLPFGAGKRVCLGEAVAKPEIFLIYTSLFQRFSFRFEEGTKHDLAYKDMAFGFVPITYEVLAEIRK